MIACEQALLFGPAKRVARVSGKASPTACHSRVYFLRHPPNGKLEGFFPSFTFKFHFDQVIITLTKVT